MASEEHVDLSIRLPPDLEEWLTEQAAEMDRGREDVVREMVAGYHAMAESDATADVLTDADAVEFATTDDVEGFVDRDALEDAIDEQHEEFTDLLDDVRKRVVQVKRETDAKAAADHGHEDLEGRLDAMEADVAELSASVSDVREDVDAGFENFEDVLEYLTETTDELEAKAGTLARVLVEVRGEVKRLSAREARRAEVEALQLAANREGVATAKCEECETPVNVGLLTAPECPHCASSFSDVVARSGLFSSNRLVTGDPPALPEAREDDLDAELAAELAEQAEDAAE